MVGINAAPYENHNSRKQRHRGLNMRTNKQEALILRRILKLVKHCATCDDGSTLTIYAGSETFGGRPIKGLTSELNLLLHGHAPEDRCKLPI